MIMASRISVILKAKMMPTMEPISTVAWEISLDLGRESMSSTSGCSTLLYRSLEKEEPRDRITQLALDMAADRIAAITMPARKGGSTLMAVIVKMPSSTPGKSRAAITPMAEHMLPMMMTMMPP